MTVEQTAKAHLLDQRGGSESETCTGRLAEAAPTNFAPGKRRVGTA